MPASQSFSQLSVDLQDGQRDIKQPKAFFFKDLNGEMMAEGKHG